MTTRRPCLSCGRDNPPDTESCAGCGRPLKAWASEPDPRPVRDARLGRGARRGLLALLALVLLAALVHSMAGSFAGEPGPLSASWRRPESVAAWAARRLSARGAAPDRIRAFVEERTSRPLRLIVASQAEDLPEATAVRAAAELLLAARAEGERLLTHAVLLELGPRGERESVLVPVGEAARLIADDEAVDSLLGHALAGPLAVLTGMPGRRPVAPGEAGSLRATGEAEPLGEPSSEEPSEAAAEAEDTPPGAEPEPAPAPEQADGADGPPGGAPEPGSVGPASEAPEPASAPRPVSVARERAESAAALVSRRPTMPVSLLQGPGSTIRSSFEAGEKGAVLLRAMIHPRQPRALVLKSLVVQPIGSLDDVEGVDFVYLVRDFDRNGRRDDGDAQVGELQTFDDDDQPAVFSNLDLSFGADNQALHLLVLVDFLDRTAGGTIMLSVPDADAVDVEEVSGGTRLRVDGAPLNGVMTTLNGDLRPGAGSDEPGGE